MQTSELILKIHIAYKGKGSAQAPSPTDPAYETYLSIANDMQDRWAEDPDHDWDTLFNGDQDFTIVNGAVSLPATACRTTSPVMLGSVPLPVVHFKQRNIVDKGVYVTGVKGSRVLHVINPLKYAGTITAGILNYPAKLTGPSDIVTCNNARWLAYQTAGMIARNDPAKEDEADRLFSLANNEYAEMASRDLRDMKKSFKLRRDIPRIPGL